MKFNNESLRAAVKEWLSDPVASEAKYGHISNWDTSQVTDMGNLFCNSNFNQPIGDWDVTNVTEMRNMFSNSTFNQPIGGWDVSNVTDMGNMFSNSAFNQPIGDWDVTNVTDMSNMFSNSAFNQWIGDWDISNVSDMNSMFSNNQNFNQNISKWEVSSFTDISEMFYGAKKVKSFCRPGGVVVQIHSGHPFGIYGRIEFRSDELRAAVNEWLSDPVASEAKYGHISNWDTSQVTDMSRLFSNVIDFNQPLNDWDVSNVNCMRYMFSGATAFNQPLNDWDVSGVTNMSYMFNGATAFNQPLNDWDVSNVINMPFMFDGATAFNQPLSDWDVSNVTNMIWMFKSAKKFNQNISNWDVGNVSQMQSMFEGATAFNQPLSDWDVSNVINMRHMFDGATAFNQTLNGWNFRNDSDTLQLDEQLPDEIVISCESHEFFYENSDGDKCSFRAYLLTCFYPDEYGEDTVYEIRDLIFGEVGEVILTFKGKNREPHIITDHPEIIDEDETYHIRDIEGEIYSVKEAVQFINSLKTVKFDSLPKADTDDFVSSEYKDWCIDNFNRTK